MTKKLEVVVLLLLAALVGVLAWAILMRGQLSETQDTLSSTVAQLTVRTTSLEETKGRLDDTSSELTSTKNELYSTQQALNNLQAALSTLANTQQKLAVAQETLRGLGISLFTSEECDVALIDNPRATNPTWNQLITFLSQDQTETHIYIRDVYDCSQFSRDVHNNAEAAGIKAAQVRVEFGYKESGHALNAFLTTDYGLVYVSCTEAPDTIARVKIREEYRAVEISRATGVNVRNDYWWDTLDSYYYIPSSRGSGKSVTSSIRIYW